MITNPYFNKGVIASIIVALVVAIFTLFVPQPEVSGVDYEYATKLFDKDKVSTIDIKIDEATWDEMLDNALQEEYVKCDLTINGETYYNVGIRPKGNTSLTEVVNDPDTDRVSFKVEFDHYVDGQTYYGLDKLALNNNFKDATSMKEYLSYDIMNYLGVVTPLYAYTQISVNGEPWGLYLALEGVEESFAQRNYGTNYGQLYKPETMGVNGGGMGKGEMQKGEKMQMPTQQDHKVDHTNETMQAPTENMQSAGDMQVPEGMQASTENMQSAGDMQVPEGMQASTENMQSAEGMQAPTEDMQPAEGMQAPTQNMQSAEGIQAPEVMQAPTENMQSTGDMKVPEGMQIPEGMQMPSKGMGGPNSSGGGADLVYTDDEVDSYSTIFDSAVFKSTTQDYQRVIKALKQLNAGEDLETYVDVDSMLRYIAANTVLVNLDSYFSNMKHNYYLYEQDGKITMLPWDYNLSFAGFQSGSATSAVNFPIDTPVSGVELSERPIIGKLLEVDSYKETYHEYLQEVVDGYFKSGRYEQTIDKIDSLISNYIKEDPTAFYTYDEYVQGVATLKQFGMMRASSIDGQLQGTIPSTTTGQQESPQLLIDASSIDLSVMGTQGGGKGDMKGGFPGAGTNTNQTGIQNSQSGQTMNAKPGDTQTEDSVSGASINANQEDVQGSQSGQVMNAKPGEMKGDKPSQMGESVSGGSVSTNQPDIQGSQSGQAMNSKAEEMKGDKPSQTEESVSSASINANQEGMQGGQSGNTMNTPENMAGGNSPQMMGNRPPGMNGENPSGTDSIKSLLVSSITLIIALLGVIVYKKRNIKYKKLHM